HVDVLVVAQPVGHLDIDGPAHALLLAVRKALLEEGDDVVLGGRLVLGGVLQALDDGTDDTGTLAAASLLRALAFGLGLLLAVLLALGLGGLLLFLLLTVVLHDLDVLAVGGGTDE